MCSKGYKHTAWASGGFRKRTNKAEMKCPPPKWCGLAVFRAWGLIETDRLTKWLRATVPEVSRGDGDLL